MTEQREPPRPMRFSGDGANIPTDLAHSNHFPGAVSIVHSSRADARADQGRAFDHSPKEAGASPAKSGARPRRPECALWTLAG
ncbi:Uncharacterised protein [Amycolatopsis camponoti]|uniref:Uncharacterized protein n=1 Tax=Amycolatopsis camponoti TaxID=2606593 RepID=A0A6I8LFX8_9PSEU|nr:Uncharacterised protein [Amycolatopsis camponoti]